jgi:serine/threonine protein kinase
MELAENLVVADRFKLVRLIGRGGMGSVWEAIHLSLDQPCAVKFIEGEVGNVADAHARFQREAKAAAQLRSPHVVQILDHGVWQGRPYIAMELLEGEDLGRLMTREGGKLALPTLNTIVQQVCRALTKAHQAGVVHRDLKPDNIFIIHDDDRPLVKILDFGVAKQTSQAIDGSNTKTGALLGTPYYMSPEQAQGIKSVDARSDLWSLAVIVYQCVTGERPFDSEALGDLLVRIIVQPVPIPSRVTQVPPGFDAWWARAAERNPDNRFPTAKEFANALTAALGLGTDTNAITSSTGIAPQLRGTAMMVHQHPPAATPQPHLAPPHQATPQPIAGHTAAHQTTPHPVGDGRGSYPGPAPIHAATPHPQGPPLHAPPPGLGSTGNPPTFGGVEQPPYAVPKRGPPVAILAAAFGVLALVGLAGVGIAMNRRSTGSGTATSGSATAPASASATVTTTAPAPASAPSVEPTASATGAIAEPSATASAEVAPSATAVAAATTSPRGVTPTAPASAAKTAAVATAKVAPSASSARKMGDDRKW